MKLTRMAGPGLTIAFLAAVGSITGCGNGPVPESTDAAPVLIAPENLFIAETETLETGPLLSGTLVAEREATLRAELGGTVVSATVDEGDRVERGQLLGRISDDAVRDLVQSARSAVRTAAEASEVAKKNLARSERLAEAGALSERDLEQARWSATNAAGALADAEARLAGAEKQWAQTQIRAPITGVVSDRHVNAGDVISTGNALFTVIDPTRLEVEARVPVSAVGSLEPGTRVAFTVDGMGGKVFDGRISRINPALDPATRQVRVTVSLPNQTGRLVAGLYAQGRVAVESRTGVVVPLSAIDRRGLRPTVTRIRTGTVERVDVTLGIEDASADRVEIASGIASGDTIVIGSARGIQPGTRVKPLAAIERTARTVD